MTDPRSGPSRTDDPALLEIIKNLNVWKRGGQRAPHKPLLLLMTLAGVQRGDERLSSYEDVHPRLDQLLRDFGPSRQSVHPEYPFWRLQNDGDFWEVPERSQAQESRGERMRTGDVPASVLREVGARGGFSSKAYQTLRENPDLVQLAAQTILDEHFPPSLHESILEAVGMPSYLASRVVSKRVADFRRELVRLYQHRCAMCGFDGRVGYSDLGLEAAHIKWHALGGPDDPRNGLLLCSMHHLALDRGAMGITNERRILVSQELHGGPQVDALMIALGGEPVAEPIDPGAQPKEEFICWHRREVFREPARP